MDINKASADELENTFQLDGTRATYLVDYRRRHGGFKSWDDVKRVPSFEEGMVENLQAAGLTIGSDGEMQDRRESHDHVQRDGDDGSGRKAHVSGEDGRHHRGNLDINSASAEELQSVFQMDGERARYLIDTRNRLGGFESWEQVAQEAPSFDEGMIHNLKEAGASIGGRRD